MSFKDLAKAGAAPHVDSPAQAEARAQAAADMKAAADAKAARNAAHREAKKQPVAAAPKAEPDKK
jgi:hypothetical protein